MARYATLEASRIAYRRLFDGLRLGSSSLSIPTPRHRLRKSYAYFGDGWKPSHPRAPHAYELIISRAHLLVEEEMPTACRSSWPTRPATTC
jgi:hypothetical protein